MDVGGPPAVRDDAAPGGVPRAVGTVRRILSRGRLWIRRRARRLRRRLGLPALSRRAVLLILLAILGLAYVSATVLGDLIMKMGRHAPQSYEPKDFERELEVQREEP